VLKKFYLLSLVKTSSKSILCDMETTLGGNTSTMHSKSPQIPPFITPNENHEQHSSLILH